MTDEQLIDHVLADGPWRFDASTAEVFDNMLERSIPQYDVMRATVDEIALEFAAAARGSRCVIDLGCSRGEAIARLVAALDSDTHFVGVEMSAPMLVAARERFASDGNVSLLELDLRLAYPEVRANVTLGVLTLQFVPIEHRQRLIQQVYDHTEPGGAFIIVEKVLGATAELDRLMTASYLAMKRRNGYTQEEIDRKRLSLEGVLVPVTAKWNVEMLRAAGFQQVDCFWRWMNFGGWVAVRQ
ncbi:MAG: methyltransferase domain-containing protein [Pseudonocardiaceae bacterium]